MCIRLRSRLASLIPIGINAIYTSSWRIVQSVRAPRILHSYLSRVILASYTRVHITTDPYPMPLSHQIHPLSPERNYVYTMQEEKQKLVLVIINIKSRKHQA